MLMRERVMNAVAGDAAEGGGDGGASLLGGLAAGEAATTKPVHELIPEKYQVRKADGSFDLEAALPKLVQGYTELSKKLGSGEVAPESAEAYVPEIALEGFDWEDFRADPQMQDFLQGAHAQGISNAQLSYVLGEYMRAAPGLVTGAQQLTQEQCAGALREHWQSEAEFAAGLGAAHRVATALCEKSGIAFAELEQAGLADNPVFIRLMAPFAKELGEDRPPHAQGLGGGKSLPQLLASEAYRDPRHRDHAATAALVKRAYEQKFGTAPAL